jgi:hypothetical protein
MSPVLSLRSSPSWPDGSSPVQRADRIAAGLPRTAWQWLSAGAGARGFRYYDWAFIALPLAEDAHGGRHWILIRRNRGTGELAFYRCWSPARTSARFAPRRRRNACTSSPAEKAPMLTKKTTRAGLDSSSTDIGMMPVSPENVTAYNYDQLRRRPQRPSSPR